MDPLDDAVSSPILLQTEIYQKADSDEELTYLLEKSEYPRIAIRKRGEARILIFSLLAVQLIEYCKGKLEVWEWNNDRAARSGLDKTIAFKHAVRRTLDFIQENFDMSFEDIMQTESWKIRLLNPVPIDGLGRIKTAMSNHNYKVFADVVKNEILPDLSAIDILKRQATDQIWLDIDLEQKDAYEAGASKKAEQMNATLDYYKYASELKNIAQQYVPKQQY